MTPQRLSRRIGDPSSARIAAKRRYRRAHRTTVPADDAAALMFLSEVLAGDTAWSLSEVKRLVAFRDRAGLSRTHEAHEARVEESERIQF